MLGKAIKPEIDSLIEEGHLDELREMLNDNLDPADIAEILEDYDDEAEAVIFRILPSELALAVFEHLDFESQESLISQLSKEKVTQILNGMSPDDRTALLEELPGEVSQRLLKRLSPEERKIARSLLNYPEDSIGRLMTPEYIAVQPEWTIAQTLEYIRENAKAVETINVIYVVDRKGHLLDDLRIGQLLLASPETKICDLQDQQYTALAATDDQEEAIDAFKRYDRNALPVVDHSGVMVGIVTIDDVFDVAEAEETEDAHLFGGSSALEDSYFATPVHELARKRGSWLSLLLVSSFLTVMAMKGFSSLTQTVTILAVFIPMIISSGGNSGSQSAALIIRGLAVREIELADWLRVFRRELLVGLGLGLFLGTIACVYALAMDHLQAKAAIEQMEPVTLQSAIWVLPTIVLLSVTGIVALGSLVGSMLPFFFKRIGFDPAVCSGPFIATFVDVSGIILYFTIAKWLLDL